MTLTDAPVGLHHATVTAPGEAPSRWAAIVHGLLGSGGGWRTFARTLVDRDPGLGVLLVDLRHHGRTGPLDGEATVSACARDLEAVCLALGTSPAAVLGHSFGGKVALAWARDRLRPFEEVWLLDSPPGARSPGSDGVPHGSRGISRLLAAMKAVDVPARTRADAAAQIVAQGVAPGVAQWSTTNLRWEPASGAYVWRMGFPAIEALLSDYFDLDGWEILESLGAQPTIHLVRGGASDRWTDGEWQRAVRAGEAAHVHTHSVPDAGHWLHVDDPEGLCRVLGEGRFFSALSPGPRMGGSTGSKAS
jgi:pimeloyl-ACP methyl ester carboxylesterase